MEQESVVILAEMQNVLLSFEGDVKLTDFGIAKIIGKTHETVTGTLKGKFAYMSPEQALGEEVDWRTDLFALGILFYEAMTGERCFKGSTDLETLEAVRKADISLPKNLEEQIPPELSTLVFKLLKKDKKADKKRVKKSKSRIFNKKSLISPRR